jgi:hypothetical protein
LVGTALPTRAQLAQLERPDAFWWATGIEDTFITAPHPSTGRTLDEYELTDHYRRWPADPALMAGLGVGCARYGVARQYDARYGVPMMISEVATSGSVARRLGWLARVATPLVDAYRNLAGSGGSSVGLLGAPGGAAA